MNPGRDDPCPCGSEERYEKCCEGSNATDSSSPLKAVAPTPAECSQLVELFKAGHYSELESQADLLVEQYPDAGFAWKLLGLALKVQGKVALPALQKATKLLPEDAEAHYNLGIALKDLGRFEEAVVSYRRAVENKADFVMAHLNLGNTLKDLGRFDQALASYQRALEINPDFAMAHLNLGVTLHELGQLEEAVASYQRALEINPAYAEVHCNLGDVARSHEPRHVS